MCASPTVWYLSSSRTQIQTRLGEVYFIILYDVPHAREFGRQYKTINAFRLVSTPRPVLALTATLQLPDAARRKSTKKSRYIQ
jgi:hypothetical protein